MNLNQQVNIKRSVLPKMKLTTLCIVLSGLFLISFSANAYCSDKNQPYDIISFSYNAETKFSVLKYNRFTGETWVLGKKGYETIQEEKAIPESLYKIEIAGITKGWYATRLDTKTGRIWRVDNGKWVEFR
jgi:hypothetical protein